MPLNFSSQLGLQGVSKVDNSSEIIHSFMYENQYDEF